MTNKKGKYDLSWECVNCGALYNGDVSFKEDVEGYDEDPIDIECPFCYYVNQVGLIPIEEEAKDPDQGTSCYMQKICPKCNTPLETNYYPFEKGYQDSCPNTECDYISELHVKNCFGTHDPNKAICWLCSQKEECKKEKKNLKIVQKQESPKLVNRPMICKYLKPYRNTPSSPPFKKRMGCYRKDQRKPEMLTKDVVEACYPGGNICFEKREDAEDSNQGHSCYGMFNPRWPACQKCDKGEECKKVTDKSMSEPIEGVQVINLGPEYFEDHPRNDPNDICPFFKDDKCTAYSPEFGEEACPPNKQYDYLRCIVYYEHIDDYNKKKQEEAEH